ncbi:hypothetical protein FD46_GL001072 [Liquorilactobacillus oeni DSM 19972]|uniref:Uncharacterized protein n=2 Tax=Liquorilactobacillus oeni TaxID=303241 RepID=A0A0R1MAR2_9LACO|nr:hypothetical protein FD46_GL001072 [Liquorilactobacillus oeni DSM 19972]
MLEQFGSRFGTALIATVVSVVINDRVNHVMQAFQTGFLVSLLGIILMFVPTFLLKRVNSNIFTK